MLVRADSKKRLETLCKEINDENKVRGKVISRGLRNSGCDNDQAEIITYLGLHCIESLLRARPTLKTVMEKLDLLGK